MGIPSQFGKRERGREWDLGIGRIGDRAIRGASFWFIDHNNQALPENLVVGFIKVSAGINFQILMCPNSHVHLPLSQSPHLPFPGHRNLASGFWNPVSKTRYPRVLTCRGLSFLSLG